MFAGWRLIAPAEREAGGDCLERSGEVQVVRDGVAAEREREREENVDLVAADDAHHSRDHEGKHDTEQQASAGVEQKHPGDVADGGKPILLCDPEKCEEQDGADAVVEEAFTGELGLEIAGAATRRSISSTAMGSVGEMRAPNKRASRSGG